MKKTKFWNNVLSTKTRKAVASALALSMVLSGASYATTRTGEADKAADAAAAFVSGDLNFDGQVTLLDAQMALKGALLVDKTLTDAQKYAGDVDGNGQLELKDAQMILKKALVIEELPDKEPPASSEEPATGPSVEPDTSEAPVASEDTVPTSKPDRATPPPDDYVPSKVPKPTLSPVPALEENVVTEYEELTVKNLNQAQVATGAGVDGREYKQYVFGPMASEITAEEISAAGVDAAVEDVIAEDGMQFENPFSGREDLREKVEDVVKTGEGTVWELDGARLIPSGPALDLLECDPRVVNAQPQGHLLMGDDIEYTRPQWTKGISYSFWLKTDEATKGAPVLVLQNDQYIFSVKANGSVRFLDGNSTDYGNCWDSQSDSINGQFGEWTHYTVTIANDWIQVYVNGQENVYNKVLMNRSKMKFFNDGFLTRYNTVSVVTQQDVNKDIRNYYSGVDSSGHSAWYLNEDTGLYEGHDDFSIFVNKRFGGTHAGQPLLMDLLTTKSTKLWIGGTETALEPLNCERQFKMNTNVADIRAYAKELTAEEVAACYTFDNVMPETITWNIANMDSDDGTGSDGNTDSSFNIAEDGLGELATYDPETDIITFKDPATEGLEVDQYRGVELVNPFAKSDIKRTIRDALEGQDIFPYLEEWGGEVAGLKTEAMGCSSYGVEVQRGNFYEVYYGDPAVAGERMDPPTGTSDVSAPVSSIMTRTQIEAAYGTQKTTYQRPKWDNGVSISFWAKPVEVDDSPIITFYRPDSVLLNVSVRGDVFYTSLDKTCDWHNYKIAANTYPYNSFTALGDAKYVNAGEWNYYTITIANDWIQVYVNGKELVYSEVNLNRQYCKQLNGGYLTRWNPKGHWTTTMIEEDGDPTGMTLDGESRNYLVKSGYLYDLTITELWQNPTDGTWHSALSDKGYNSGKDSASVRANGVYENPYNTAAKSSLLVDSLLTKKTKLYLGGVTSVLSLDLGFTLADLQFSTEEATDEEFKSLVHFKDIEYKTEEVVDPTTGEKVIVPTEEETVYSRCKYLFTDHLLDKGTQITGFDSFEKELTAQEVKDLYQQATAPTAK